MKFGGTSVGKPQRMHDVAALITKDQEPKIVVLSAVSGTTNSLVEIAGLLAAQKREEAKEKIDALEAKSCTKKARSARLIVLKLLSTGTIHWAPGNIPCRRMHRPKP